MQVAIIGLDIAKHVFQLHGTDTHGKVVLRRRLRRQEMVPFFANLPPCTVGLEACGGAHYWARRLREECLRVSWFENLFDARRKIADWRKDYNEQRPHSSLGYKTPAEFAAAENCGKDAGYARLENAVRVSTFPQLRRLLG